MMSDRGFFDEGAYDAGLADLRAIARRQLSVSLAVAITLLGLTGLATVRAPHEGHLELAAWRGPLEAARVEVALPALEALTP